ncbi:hypothetical protein [Bordetella bronchiseptica]|uniref:hypothetical protein n=1 Tax=Bordetella bronchiseptica TaxID=518 RepID=UPI0004616BBA|nr:hypothetical protein [Bordetella bronchiseptica]KDC15335.1 hypothetical protein L542_2113 [Bordetella bronchiseptica F-1]KDC29327.1 hypothetical protein L504_2140 [Bordetella bronchiseptica F2]
MTDLSSTVEVLLLRDALDHIMRTARASRTQTRRIRWVESRARAALEGRVYDAQEHDLPPSADSMVNKNLRLRVENAQLRRVLAQIAGGATGLAERDTELAELASAALEGRFA